MLIILNQADDYGGIEVKFNKIGFLKLENVKLLQLIIRMKVVKKINLNKLSKRWRKCSKNKWI